MVKSHVRGFLPLVRAMLLDYARKCQASVVDAERDLVTITARCENEGLSFLTITLPDLGACFTNALVKGQVDQSEFPGWKFQKHLPALLRGFACLVFDSTTGRLLDEPNIEAIRALRQICLAFKKLGLPCSKERNEKAVKGFIATERSLQCAVFDDDLLDKFSQVSHLLWGNLFGDFDHHALFPKHGPGAVVEHYTQNSKYNVRRWHERLEPFFPVDEYGMCNISHFEDWAEQLTLIPEEFEEPVKVTLVPKTLKTPRVIAIEPMCQQLAQQALKSYLVKKLESGLVTGGHVNFTDQTINQNLAMAASLDGSLATLDLSEASDRVSLKLVTVMLEKCPDLLDALLACRSTRASLPNGVTIPLSKFASMGSAVCFPVEAMVFFTIIIVSILERRNLPLTSRNIFRVTRDVYVYGDDLIVPVDMASAVSDSLSHFGCKVNSSKSFSTGRFRESCGVDAYNGELVTPTYVRSTWPETKGDASSMISLVATGNQLLLKGLYRSFDVIRQHVEKRTGPLPVVNERFAGLGWLEPAGRRKCETRFNKRLQRIEVRTLVPQPVYRIDTLDDWPALFKFFLSSRQSGNGFAYSGPAKGLSYSLRNEGELSSHPVGCPIQLDFISRTVDEKHLERSPRHGAVGTKRQWVPLY